MSEDDSDMDATSSNQFSDAMGLGKDVPDTSSDVETILGREIESVASSQPEHIADGGSEGYSDYAVDAVDDFGTGLDLDFESLGFLDKDRLAHLHEAAWDVPNDLDGSDTNADPTEAEEVLPDEDEHVIDENDDFEDFGKIDWEKFRGFGKDRRLSAWDELSAGYYQQFSSIAEKLDAYDLAICRAFSYKVQTSTTD
ncbi:uncharacterized protein EV420DRAFT_1479414 [Desarmillaria tabescens]|uniref:Uncharacterized protein n=1 Tax=Armillaria tabescens TaxID=1929756 RepID=A0AA39N5Z8_ARMTA|nr:uncharacterized protein EV420DRAFT_1479414 [Desarmillaria tabescens]KAK0458718.1 hypothetical protein EV420DRAFT_1479414 [Desarmillaria tabescens]